MTEQNTTDTARRVAEIRERTKPTSNGPRLVLTTEDSLWLLDTVDALLAERREWRARCVWCGEDTGRFDTEGELNEYAKQHSLQCAPLREALTASVRAAALEEAADALRGIDALEAVNDACRWDNPPEYDAGWNLAVCRAADSMKAKALGAVESLLPAPAEAAPELDAYTLIGVNMAKGPDRTIHTAYCPWCESDIASSEDLEEMKRVATAHTFSCEKRPERPAARPYEEPERTLADALAEVVNDVRTNNGDTPLLESEKNDYAWAFLPVIQQHGKPAARPDPRQMEQAAEAHAPHFENLWEVAQAPAPDLDAMARECAERMYDSGLLTSYEAATEDVAPIIRAALQQAVAQERAGFIASLEAARVRDTEYAYKMEQERDAARARAGNFSLRAEKAEDTAARLRALLQAIRDDVVKPDKPRAGCRNCGYVGGHEGSCFIPAIDAALAQPATDGKEAEA